LRKKKIDSLLFNSSVGRVIHFRDTLFVETNNPIVAVDTSKISLTDKDTVSVSYASYISKKKNKIAFLFNKKPEQKYSLNILPEAFFDIFDQKNDTLTYNFNSKEIEDYGRITIKIENPFSQNLIIELLEGKDKNTLVERKLISKSQEIRFDLLEPKTYYIRAIIDTNKNNRWDTGNYLLKQQPEKVIYFAEELKLRANYFLDGNIFMIDR
jgi:hypothetical protein